jgi:hypothetical protein
MPHSALLCLYEMLRLALVTHCLTYLPLFHVFDVILAHLESAERIRQLTAAFIHNNGIVDPASFRILPESQAKFIAMQRQFVRAAMCLWISHHRETMASVHHFTHTLYYFDPGVDCLQQAEAIRPVVMALDSLHNVALKRVKDMRTVCQDALDRYLLCIYCALCCTSLVQTLRLAH